MDHNCISLPSETDTGPMPITGFCIILAFLVAGELISSLTGHFMPGSVIGMVLLFLALCARLIKTEWIRQASDFLTRNMTVLFIPSAIGILDQWGIIRADLVTWLVMTVVCWALVLAASGWTHQAVARLKKRKGDE